MISCNIGRIAELRRWSLLSSAIPGGAAAGNKGLTDRQTEATLSDHRPIWFVLDYDASDDDAD